MPFPLPSLDDLRQRGRAFLAVRVPGFAPSGRRSPLAALADMAVSLVWDTLRYLNWQFLQLFPETAEGAYLDRFGARYGLPRTQAQAAAGAIAITASAGPVAILAGTLLQTTDGSVTVQTQVVLNLGSGIGQAAVVAVTPGSVGNLPAGTLLAFVSAIAGVLPTATVVLASDGINGLTGGLDVETDAAYAARIRQREQRIPQGGASGDYIGWAELTPGVTRAWEYPRNRGTGTIDVAFVMDQRDDIIPLAADVAACQASLDANRSVVGDCVAFAPLADAIAVRVVNLTYATGTTAADGEAAIQTALTSFFLQATPGGAGDGPGIDAAHPAGLLRLEALSDAITQTPGIGAFDLLAPTADIVSAHGHLATLGALAFA